MPRLIILGCGALGRRVSRLALDAGWTVDALVRSPGGVANLHGLGLRTVVAADIAGTGWHGDLDPTGALVLGCVAPGAPDIDTYRHTYAGGAASIAHWLHGRNAAGLLWTSSTSVYGATDGSWADESSPVLTDSPAEAALLAAESILLAPDGDWPVACVLRCAALHDPVERPLRMVPHILAGRPMPGRPDTFLNLLHLDDAAAAHWLCLQAMCRHDAIPARSRFNLSDGTPATRATLASALATRLGRPCPPFDNTPASRRSQLPDGSLKNRRIDTSAFRATFNWTPAHPGPLAP